MSSITPDLHGDIKSGQNAFLLEPVSRIDLTVSRVLFVLALAVVMCTVSGLGALRKVRSADPADLF